MENSSHVSAYNHVINPFPDHRLLSSSQITRAYKLHVDAGRAKV